MKRKGRLWFSEIATKANVEKSAMWVAGLIYDKDGNRVFHEQKRPTKQQLHIAEHFDEVVAQVLNELTTLNYDFGRVHEFFTVEGRKVRKIDHLDKHGSILLNCVMNVCQPYFIDKYIPFTYSSIKGRGLVDCARRIKRIVAAHPDWYYYQADARHCYESTSHSVAMDAIKQVFKDKHVLEFFEKMLALVPGLAIGFCPNHYIMNAVFSQLDHRMIECEGFASGYSRYMDDIVVIAPDIDSCIKADRVVREEFARLGLQVKANSRIAPVASGVDYCGYIFYPSHTRLRKSIKLNMQRRHRQLLKRGAGDDELRRQMASYHGWCKWADCRHLEKTMYKDKLNLFKRKMEAKRLSEVQKKKWFGMEHDRFISTNIFNDRRLYDSEFTVLEIESHTFDDKPGLVVHIQIGGEDYYTITKSSSLIERFPRAWEAVGNAPFIARLKMQQSKSNPNCKYPILV